MIANYASTQAKFDRHVLTNLMKLGVKQEYTFAKCFLNKSKEYDLIKVQDRGSPQMIFIQNNSRAISH